MQEQTKALLQEIRSLRHALYNAECATAQLADAALLMRAQLNDLEQAALRIARAQEGEA